MDNQATRSARPATKKPRKDAPAPRTTKSKTTKRRKRRTPEEIAHDNWYEGIRGRLDSITGWAVWRDGKYQHKARIVVIEDGTLISTAEVIESALEDESTTLNRRHKATLRRFARILRRRAR